MMHSADSADPHHTPEQRLFRAILTNAVGDAIAPVITNQSTAAVTRQQARHWLETAGADYRIICEGAGLNPAYFQKAALQFIDQVLATPKPSRTLQSLKKNKPGQKGASHAH